MKKTFQLIVGVFVLAQILPLVTTTPIPPSHSNSPAVIASTGGTGPVEPSSTCIDPADNDIVVTEETTKWEQPSYGYIYLSPGISNLAGIESSSKLRIGVPLSKHKDGVKSFNDILFMLRYLLQNGPARDTLSIWISQKRRDIRQEDTSFVVETQDCMQAIACTVDVLVEAVEKHNNRFAVKPTEWDKERDRHKVKKPLVPSHSNAPISGNLGASSVQMAGSVIQNRWDQPSYCYFSIPKGLVRPLGLEESTSLRIGVPLSKHQDGVKSFNDIMFMMRSLIPPDDKNSRTYIRGWISQKRQKIATEDQEFVVEGAKNRSEVKCTVEDLRNAIQKHNQHFAIPPQEWSRREGRCNKPGPVHGSGQSPQQPRNQYDQEMLAKLMPAPTNMQPQGPPLGASGSGFGLQHHHGVLPGQSYLPHDGPQRFDASSDLEGPPVLRNPFHNPSAGAIVPGQQRGLHTGSLPSIELPQIEESCIISTYL